MKEGISKAIGVANAELPDGEYKTCLVCELERAKSIVGEDAESNNTAHTRALVAMSLVIAAIMAKE